MKKFTFLSAVALMAGSLSANAQLSNGTDYIIQNVESGKYLGGGNSWGTQASLLDHPQIFTATLADGVYKLDSHQSNGGNNHFLSDNGYVDGGGSAITLEPVEGGAYTLKVGAKFAGVDGTVVTMLDANPNATWKVVSVANALAAAKKSAYQGTPADVTFLIKDPNFSRNDQNASAWIRRSYDDKAGVANHNISGGNNSNNCAESWRSNNGFNIYQTVSVPNGVYTLAGQAAMNNYDKLTENLPVVYANDLTSDFVNITAGETSMSAMSGSFSNGMYAITPIEGVTPSNGVLKIGVKSPLTSIWALWDNFSLSLTSWCPSVGALVTDSESNLEIAPTACPTITVTAPNADYIEGFELAGKWELVEGQKVIASGEGADKLVISDLPLEADKQYMLNYSFCIMQNADAVDMESGEIQIRTLNAKELAILNYSKAVEEAYALAEYAGQHIGVGVMLYLPAKYEQYKKDLSQAVYAIGTPTNYVDAKEGEQIIRGLMLEFMPQYPKLNQRYLIQHKASKLYMKVDNDKVTLNGAPTPVMFHHVEGAGLDAEYYMYSTPDRKYVYYTGDNKWSLTGQTTKLDLGHWIIRHHCTLPDPTTANNSARNAYYSLVGVNGALGSDAVEAGSSLFGNKDENAANSQWLIIPYTEPELTDDDLASGDYYIRNRETGKYFGAANSWGTQASLVENAQKFTATMIMDGVYTLDSHTYNNANAHFVGDGGFVDSNATNLDITSVGKGFYTISVGGKFYSAPAEGTVAELGDNAGARSEWQFLTKKQLLEEVADGESTDLTFLIQDPNFSRNCMAQETNPWDVAPAKNGDVTNFNAEKWGGNSQEFDSHQTIEIPNGIYRITCQGYYRYNNTTDNTNQVAIDSHADGTEVINSFLYANDKQVALKSIADDEAAAVLASLPFSQGDASAAFNQGLYVNELVVEVTNGKLTLGIKKTSHPGCDWTVWDNFQIHTSSAAEAALLAAINGNIEDAEATAISSASTVAAPVAIYSVNGTQINGLQKGINIVKMADGSVKKIMK